MSPELRSEYARRIEARRKRIAESGVAEPPLPRLTEVYVTSLSSQSASLNPKPLGGGALKIDQTDWRVGLVDWMIDDKNEFFARNFVNRAWAHYFGQGLVEPWDALSSQASQPHAELLSELAQWFIRSGYNIRALEQLILSSRAWQLSSINRSEQSTSIPFARSYVRLPTAEGFIDMWHAATGNELDFGNDSLRGLKAVEVGPDRLRGNRWDKIFDLFGQPNRGETCDCHIRNRPSVRQLLALMSDPQLVSDIATGRLQALLKSELNNDQIVDELFLSTLSRWPTDHERALTKAAMAGQERQTALENVLASLLVTQEFLTIH